MATVITGPLIAIYANRGTAEAAVDELWHAGFPKDQVGIAAPGQPVRKATTATEGLEAKAAEGASTGALTGTAVGGLAGAVAAALIPGFGPVLAGGLLVGLVGGAAAGAALGTFAGPFLALGVMEPDAHRYEKEFRAGRTIVAVKSDRVEEALTILRSHGPLRVEAGGQPVHQ